MMMHLLDVNELQPAKTNFIRQCPLVQSQQCPCVTCSYKQLIAKVWGLLNLCLHLLWPPARVTEAGEWLTNVNIHSVANIIIEPKKPTYWHLPPGYFYMAKHEYAFLPQTWERKICPICVNKLSARWPTSHLRLLGRLLQNPHSAQGSLCCQVLKMPSLSRIDWFLEDHSKLPLT